MRGILGGGFWGIVVGGAAVAGASLVNPPPDRDGSEPIAENTLAESASESVAPVAGASAPDVVEPEEGTAPPSLTRETAVDLSQQPETVTPPESEDSPADIADETPPTPDNSAIANGNGGEDDTSAASPNADENSTGAVVADAVTAPAAPDETQAPEAVAEADPAPETSEAPPAVAALDVANTTAPSAETDPAAQPEVTAAESLEAPSVANESGLVAAEADTPVLPNPQSQAPTAPGADTLDLAAADTANPPGVAPEIASDAPVSGQAPASESNDAELVASSDARTATPSTPTAPTTEDAAGDLPAADTNPPAADEEVATGPIGEDSTVIVVEPPAEEVVVVDDGTTPTVSVLPGGSSAVKVNRFGADAGTAAAEALPPAPDPESFPDGTPAIVRYAVPAENPNNLPELSVVLVDDGALPDPVFAVANVGFPVSVMLHPTAPDATSRMQAYRAAGIEVGLIVTLPPSATPTDVAVFFEAALSSLPETVAVLDADGETQADADVIRETVAALADDGRGLITVPRGLNSAQRVASENGVPAGVIFRELDSEGQDARVIGRFMDQAAFRARQVSGVILLGQVRDQTVTALTEWSSGSRAQQVAMQPVSSVLGEN